ncbi:MAG: histidine kinase, partial [Bauldia sp.]
MSVTAEIGSKNAPPSTEADAGGRAVNLAELARQTGGDRGLEREVLGLFLARSAADLERLKAAVGAARRETAHLIV